MKIFRQIGSLAFVLGLFTTIFAGVPWLVVVEDDPVIPWWFRIAIFSLLGGILIVLVAVAIEQRKAKALTGELPTADSESRILLLNSTDVPGRDSNTPIGAKPPRTSMLVPTPSEIRLLKRYPPL